MDDEWEPPLPAGYGDANRAFIQAFMARGALTFREAQELLAAIKTAAASAAASAEEGGGGEDSPGNNPRSPVRPQSITPAEVDNAMRVAREAVEPLDYDIRNARDQLRAGERVWAFINAHSDPATQLGTARSPEEVAYVKRLLDAMFETYNTPRMEVMAVDEGQALRVSRPAGARRESAMHSGNGENEDENGEDGGATQSAAASRGLKHSEVLSLLSSLVAEGWLDKSRDGFYSLTARSLMELWGWLMATYNDADADAPEWQRIKFCEACKEIVTSGQRCNNPDCVIRLHDICEEAFWRARAEKTCPKCSTAWEGTHFVGERAATSRSGFQRGRGRRGRRSEAAAVEEAEEGAEESEDGE
ncbi:Nse1 non-SMC component of SMC5-6 complex-domain-containing protein [Staphylotrichum tortipilum]|uniref:Non-structural maintenance of chromosomes element 1 homolog n=1 Tax=Staphylotrichum tortipilum TaxID=2831512 RepID=A0AAN6MHP9_9PEZI|nr:Nse1 non-SMC component of SMC5-6 complex-domain-containing protein [Staphylotrichum longicolle]